MNVLLINQNATVDKLVTLSTQKVGFTMQTALDGDSITGDGYNLVIVDHDILQSVDCDALRGANSDAKLMLLLPKNGEHPEGFDLYVEKPFLPTELVGMFKDLESAASDPAPTEESLDALTDSGDDLGLEDDLDGLGDDLGDDDLSLEEEDLSLGDDLEDLGALDDEETDLGGEDLSLGDELDELGDLSVDDDELSLDGDLRDDTLSLDDELDASDALNLDEEMEGDDLEGLELESSEGIDDDLSLEEDTLSLDDSLEEDALSLDDELEEDLSLEETASLEGGVLDEEDVDEVKELLKDDTESEFDAIEETLSSEEDDLRIDLGHNNALLADDEFGESDALEDIGLEGDEEMLNDTENLDDIQESDMAQALGEEVEASEEELALDTDLENTEEAGLETLEEDSLEDEGMELPELEEESDAPEESLSLEEDASMAPEVPSSMTPDPQVQASEQTASSAAQLAGVLGNMPVGTLKQLLDGMELTIKISFPDKDK